MYCTSIEFSPLTNQSPQIKPKMGFSRFNFRSVSLPSRVQPINAAKIESHLQKLKSWQVPNSLPETVPITSQTILSDLQVLSEMYICVHDAARSPAIDQLQKSLECSVELLDSCSIIRELVLTTKENVQALQSALRRKGLDTSVQYDIIAYTCFRKRIKKSIAKILKNLKSKNASHLSLKEAFSREVASLTVALFKCILLFLSSPTAKPRAFASKLALAKPDGTLLINSEVGSVDFAVRALQGRIRSNGVTVVDIQILQRNLQKLDVCIGEFEKGLEGLFRLLVRSRVSVLNMVTDQLM